MPITAKRIAAMIIGWQTPADFPAVLPSRKSNPVRLSASSVFLSTALSCVVNSRMSSVSAHRPTIANRFQSTPERIGAVLITVVISVSSPCRLNLSY